MPRPGGVYEPELEQGYVDRKSRERSRSTRHRGRKSSRCKCRRAEMRVSCAFVPSRSASGTVCKGVRDGQRFPFFTHEKSS